MNTFYNKVKFFLLASGVVVHGISTLAFQRDITTPYYEALKDHSYIRPQLISRTIQYSLTPTSQPSEVVKFTPVASNFLGLGLHLFDVDVGLNLPIKPTAGKRNLDLQGHITTRSWGIDAMWQRYTKFRPPKSFSDPRLSHTLINGYYVFNHHKFSQRAVTNQNEYQARSAGSPILSTRIAHLAVEDNQLLIPAESRQFFGELGDVDRYNHWVWAILPGYSYSMVEKPFILNVAGGLGIAHYWERYEIGDQIVRDVNFRPIVEGSSYIGVDTKKYFGGIRMELKYFRSGSNSVTNKLFFYSVRLAAGFRFVEKGVLKKGVGDIFRRK